MSRTKFLIKKKYNKILNSLMSAEDKIDYTLEKISASIVKLGEARTAIVKLNNDKLKNQKDAVENKIIELQKSIKSSHLRRPNTWQRLKCWK